MSAGVEESSALEDIGGPGASGVRLHVEALPAFAGRNPTITPQRYVEDRLPGDVSETTLVYATVKALRAAVDGVDAACRQDAAAAAWHAEPLVRFFCSTFGAGSAGDPRAHRSWTDVRGAGDDVHRELVVEHASD